jgi:hypothetical protein
VGTVVAVARVEAGTTMIRITVYQTPEELVLKLEGCLVGDSVDALDSCWRQAARTLAGRRLQVDLRALCQVDGRGRTVLTRLHAAGARFVASGCVMPEIVREIAAEVPRLFSRGSDRVESST